MNFDFFKMPDWGPIIIGVWAFVSLVVWYLYRHSAKKYRVGFKTTFLLISALFFFVFLINRFKERPQSDPLRIAVFPFINQSDTSASISWESLAFSEIPIRYLEQINLEELLPYQLDWLTSAANSDSLTFQNYCLDFAKRIKVDYVVVGSFLKESSDYSLSYRLIQFDNDKTVLEEISQITLNGIQEFSQELSRSVANRILESDSELFLKDPWHSNDKIRAFFNLKLFLLNRETSSAFGLAKNAVKTDSNSTTWLNSLAKIYLNRGGEKKQKGQNDLEDFQAAKSLLLKSLFLDESNHKTLQLLAELYLAHERWNQAEEFLQRSLLRNHWDSKTYVDLTQLHASRYADLGFGNENELLEKAIFVNPLDFEARLILADNYSQKNRSDLAIKTVKEILRINPNRVDALMKLGTIYMSQNDLLNSLEIYQKVTELDPGNGEVYYNLGIVYYQQKDYITAINFFEHAIKSIDHVDSHLYLAYIYEQQKDMNRAITHLRTRIAKRSGRDDKFAEEARKHLFQIMSEREAKDPKVSQTKTQN